MPTRLSLEDQHERARAWAAFVEANGRQPGNRPEAPRSESSLYYWIFQQRKADAAGALAPEVRAVLDEAAPNWQYARDPARPNPDLHVKRAQDYLSFVMKYGRAPSQLARGTELSLHHWMTNQRATLALGKLHPDVHAAISAELPGWDAPSGKPPRQPRGKAPSFAVRMWELEGYLSGSGGVLPPSNGSPGADESLGRWLQHQRRLLSRGDLKRARRRALDKIAPGWETPRRAEQKWSRRVEDLAAFVARHDRLPRHTRKDDAERSLQSWLANARKDDLSPEQVTELDTAVPGWRGREVRDAWAARVREIEHFVGEHGHRPRPQGATPEERRMGFWLTRQRRAKREGHLSPEAEALLSEGLPGWDEADRRQAAPRAPRVPRPRGPQPDPPVKRERKRKPGRPAAKVTTDDLIEQAQREVLNRNPVLPWDDPFEYSQRVLRRFLKLSSRVPEAQDRAPDGSGS